MRRAWLVPILTLCASHHNHLAQHTEAAAAQSTVLPADQQPRSTFVSAEQKPLSRSLGMQKRLQLRISGPRRKPSPSRIQPPPASPAPPKDSRLLKQATRAINSLGDGHAGAAESQHLFRGAYCVVPALESCKESVWQ